MFDEKILEREDVRKSTIRMYGSSMRKYIKFCDGKGCATDPVLFLLWKNHLIDDTENSPNSINRDLSAVKSIFSAAYKQGLVDSETLDRISVNAKAIPVSNLAHRTKRTNRTRISPEQMREICNAPDVSTRSGRRDRAFLLCLATSGCRISEIVSMKRGCILDDGNGRYYTSVIGKRDDAPRDVLVSPEAKEAIDLMEHDSTQGNHFLFQSQEGRGGRWSNKGISVVAGWTIVRKYADMVGIKNVKPHDFRRFVGTQIGRNNLYQAMKVLGHSSITTTYKFYVQADVELGITDNLF